MLKLKYLYKEKRKHLILSAIRMRRHILKMLAMFFVCMREYVQAGFSSAHFFYRCCCLSRRIQYFLYINTRMRLRPDVPLVLYTLTQLHINNHICVYGICKEAIHFDFVEFEWEVSTKEEARCTVSESYTNNNLDSIWYILYVYTTERNTSSHPFKNHPNLFRILHL